MSLEAKYPWLPKRDIDYINYLKTQGSVSILLARDRSISIESMINKPREYLLIQEAAYMKIYRANKYIKTFSPTENFLGVSKSCSITYYKIVLRNPVSMAKYEVHTRCKNAEYLYLTSILREYIPKDVLNIIFHYYYYLEMEDKLKKVDLETLAKQMINKN